MDQGFITLIFEVWPLLKRQANLFIMIFDWSKSKSLFKCEGLPQCEEKHQWHELFASCIVIQSVLQFCSALVRICQTQSVSLLGLYIGDSWPLVNQSWNTSISIDVDKNNVCTFVQGPLPNRHSSHYQFRETSSSSQQSVVKRVMKKDFSKKAYDGMRLI